MSRVYRLRLFGREVGSWEVEGESVDPTELLADALASLVADNTPDDTENNTADPTPNHTPDHTGNVGGGSGHNFERDLEPLYPGVEKDYDSWIERPFGFQP